MKGLSVWIWIIGGLIVGMVMFTMFIQLLSYINLSKDREFAKENFGVIVKAAQSVCESREGTIITKIVSFPELTKGVYSTNHSRYFIETGRGLGRYICIQFEKETLCEEIKCNVEMIVIKPEKNLLNLVSRIVGESGYTDFTIKIIKNVCGVSILFPGQETECVGCDFLCNAVCNKQCESEPDYPDNDPDCKRMLDDTFWCEGDKKCDSDRGENCGNSKDCPPIQKNLPEGSLCGCKEECISGLKCTKNHCCPEGKKWNGEKCVYEFDVLIAALKSNLREVYSDSQISQLESKISEYARSLEDEDLSAGLLYLDEDKVSDLIGNKVTNPDDWNNVNGILRQLVTKMNVKYVLIVGGYHRFPSGKASSFDSDNPYGDTTGDYIPDIAIGRVPEPNGGDIDLLLKAFGTFTNLHKSGGIDLRNHIGLTLGMSYTTMTCFSQYVWGKQCSQYPNCKLDTSAKTDASGKDFFYLTEHGDIGPPQYYGGFNSPSDVTGMDVSNAMWMIVPCYGGVVDYSSTSQGYVLTFFKQGGAIHLSSTYENCCADPSGSCTERIDEGVGELYYLTAKNFAPGVRVGDAYKIGKSQYINTGDGIGEGWFNNFYGDPTLKIKNMWS